MQCFRPEAFKRLNTLKVELFQGQLEHEARCSRASLLANWITKSYSFTFEEFHIGTMRWLSDGAVTLPNGWHTTVTSEPTGGRRYYW